MTKERKDQDVQANKPRKFDSDGPMNNRNRRSAETMTQDEAEWGELEQDLSAALERWDARIEPPLPPLAAFEQLVGEQRARSRSRLWRDLFVFWTVAALILSLMVLVVESSIIGFVILQATVFVAAIAFVATGVRSKEGAEEWRS
ncbi:YxlC family protein [Paenibacillus xanthanilyticus]|uniref:YxlC family protein n=1 Tax=Paenibacillus xanthanilyticus TaxID=1783531 RepID=A0ABV8K4G0_9BACL